VLLPPARLVGGGRGGAGGQRLRQGRAPAAAHGIRGRGAEADLDQPRRQRGMMTKDALTSIRERLLAASEGEDRVVKFETSLPECLVQLNTRRVGNDIIVSNKRGESLVVRILGPGKFKTAENHNPSASPETTNLLDFGGGVEQGVDELISALTRLAAERS